MNRFQTVICHKTKVVIFLLAFFITTNHPSANEYTEKKELICDVYKPISINYLHELFDNCIEKQDELNEMFRVKKIYKKFNENVFHEKSMKKIIAFSLFWKAPHTTWQQPIVTQESIHQVRKFSRKTCSFYKYYVLPMINTIKRSAKFYPGWIFRIYLAADLEFLVDHLQKETNAEIHLMSSNSIAHSPGAMWRFLAFDDPDAYIVCIKDSDEKLISFRDNMIISWLKDPSTEGWYRLRDIVNIQEAVYSPIVASCFGAKNVPHIDMEKAMKGFILHRQLYPDELRHPRDISYEEHPYGFGNEFPTYGFDERFLKHVIYYEAAFKGQLTTLPLRSIDAENGAQSVSNASKDTLIYMDFEFLSMYNPHHFYGAKMK